jgi:hypothetical protein
VYRLVEERQVEVFDVHEFELGVGALVRFRKPIWLRLRRCDRAVLPMMMAI